ncbi:tail fiber protein [Salmonella enterica]
MKPLMKPIDTPDQVFHDGDPSTGELGTICSAEWLNDTQASIRDIQAECITILRANGFEPDETKRDQLWQAIQAAIKNHVPAASLVGAGIVQLSSSVTSDSETIAATLKAVKIAMDNGNARLAKERNLADLTNVPLARQSLQLGNSATRDVGTTTGTVAAGDDARITGAMQKAMNGSDIPDKAAFCRALGLGALATSDGIDALIKSQNGADIPDKALFVQNLGLTDTVNRASHVNATDGDLYGTQWGGWLSSYIRRNTPSVPSLTPYATTAWVSQNFVRDVRMGANVSTTWGANGGTCPPGYVLTGGDFNDNVEYPVYAPVQKQVYGIWYNVGRE